MVQRWPPRAVLVGGHPSATEIQVDTGERLRVRLLSDSDHTVSQAYGVWVKKNNYGHKYMGIERSTFLIDEAGKLRAEWRKVKVKGHVDEVLAAAQALS